MIDNTKEYILCAAIKRKEPRDCQPYHPNTNDICNIELGYRHHDIFHRFDGEMSECEQGFYTSKGRYVDRYEGMEIAFNAGNDKWTEQTKRSARVSFDSFMDEDACDFDLVGADILMQIILFDEIIYG